MNRDILHKLNALRHQRQAALVVTVLQTGAQELILPDSIPNHPLSGHLASALQRGKGMTITPEDEAEIFIDVYVPSPRFVIVGAVHITQTLAPLAERLGYAVTILDPRTAFATEERFPGLNLIAEWPEEVDFEALLDPWTAFAALTHDPKIDDEPLMAALNAGCFYIGALGSRKTHGKRLNRLTEMGATAAQLDQIRAPIGLAIGAASPPEIAVSIMAEVTALLRGGKILGDDVLRDAMAQPVQVAS